MTTVVIGCGNPLRSDDGAGPATVRRLAESGLPCGVRCIDAGTDGVAAAFQMRGAAEVILIDACRSGSPPGTVHTLAGDRVECRMPVRGLSLHALRWDHAVALGSRLFGAGFPRRVTILLVEGARFGVGVGLSPRVDRAVGRLADDLAAGLRARRGQVHPGADGSDPPTVRIAPGA